MQVNSHNEMNLSKREMMKYQQTIERIEKRQIGSLLISMISYDQTKIQQLIEQSIEDFEQEYSTLQDFHITKQTKIYKSMQQLKTQLLEYNQMLSQFIDGPQEKEKQFYQQQANRLNQLINQNYQTIDQKEVQLIKLQNKLSQQIDDYDSNIAAIDQILLTIDSILFDEQKVGIQFFQKRGKINQLLDILNQSTLKLVDLPMIKQIIQIGIKQNFNDNKTYKQTQELLLQLRNKLVNELNKLNTQKIDQLEEEIQQLENDTLKMKQQLLESTQKLGIEARDTSEIEKSKKRIEEELKRLDEDLRLENEIFEKKENYLMEEVNELMEINVLLRNRELIEFIKQ